MLAQFPIPEFSVSNDLKPARRFVAQAIQIRDGYLAQWAAPGMVPRNVQENGGVDRVYRSQAEAQSDARRVMFEALNAGIHSDGKNKLAAYAKMSGPDLAVALADIDVTPTWFAFIMANNYQRVLDWMTGAQDIPHVARVLVEIFKRSPGAMDIAEDVTKSVASERLRRPARDAQQE